MKKLLFIILLIVLVPTHAMENQEEPQGSSYTTNIVIEEINTDDPINTTIPIAYSSIEDPEEIECICPYNLFYLLH